MYKKHALKKDFVNRSKTISHIDKYFKITSFCAIISIIKLFWVLIYMFTSSVIFQILYISDCSLTIYRWLKNIHDYFYSL